MQGVGSANFGSAGPLGRSTQGIGALPRVAARVVRLAADGAAYEGVHDLPGRERAGARVTSQFDTTSFPWRQSTAIAVIFGLLVATILTLGVVPALSMAYDAAGRRLRRSLNLAAPAEA